MHIKLLSLKVLILLFNLFVYLFVWSAFLGAQEVIKIDFVKPVLDSNNEVTIKIDAEDINKYRIRPVGEVSMSIFDSKQKAWVDSTSLWTQLPKANPEMRLKVDKKVNSKIEVKFGIQDLNTGEIMYTKSTLITAKQVDKIVNNPETYEPSVISEISLNEDKTKEKFDLVMLTNYINEHSENFAFISVVLLFLSVTGLKIIREKTEFNVQYNP